MKKFLLPENSVPLKANLHCHSTFSDGRRTPEELKEAYKKHGYSIIAYTDHNRLVDHQDLTDDTFLALNGYEIDITENTEGMHGHHRRTCHFCLIAKKPDLAPIELERKYDPDNINAIFARAKEAGFFVTYNHPVWSNERYPDYSKYKGMDAMEIWNTGCVYAGYDDYNCHQYQDFLTEGQRIFCLATDDNHNGHPFDSPDNDSFGGWVTICAEKLDYESVIAALEKGEFYASCGPEIKALWIEDGYVHVKTSPAHAISYISIGRHHDTVRANYGETVDEAVFKIDPAADVFFRIDVVDDYGRHANTNAVFTDTL